MSHNNYIIGRKIEAKGWPFYAVLMAAMRQADTDNLDKLREAFPETHRELLERYQAPGGHLPGEPTDDIVIGKEGTFSVSSFPEPTDEEKKEA